MSTSTMLLPPTTRLPSGWSTSALMIASPEPMAVVTVPNRRTPAISVVMPVYNTPDKLLRAAIESVLAEAVEAGLVLDAVVAQSLAQAKSMWALRENITEAQAREGQNLKHDVSVPVSRIAEFIAATDAEIRHAYPSVRMVTFGHLGDENPWLLASAALDCQWVKESRFKGQFALQFSPPLSCMNGGGRLMLQSRPQHTIAAWCRPRRWAGPCPRAAGRPGLTAASPGSTAPPRPGPHRRP